jgi:excisionase family DNA binding protein
MTASPIATPPPADDRPPLTVKEVARRLNQPPSTVYLRIARREFEVLRHGPRGIRVPAAVVDALVAASVVPAATTISTVTVTA